MCAGFSVAQMDAVDAMSRNDDIITSETLPGQYQPIASLFPGSRETLKRAREGMNCMQDIFLLYVFIL